MGIRCAVAFGVLVAAGCADTNGGAGPNRGESPAKAAVVVADAEPAAAEEMGPALARLPTIDLVANRFRWHLYRPGLVIPIASEGLRNYAQDYARPWADVVEVDGKSGRVLERRSTVLRFPWHAREKVRLVFRVHGLTARQRVSLSVNGKRLRRLSMGDGWRVLAREAEVVAGENELELRVERRGRAAGVKSYGLFHSIEVEAVTAGEATGDRAWPALTPVGEVTAGTQLPALVGFGRMWLQVEVPPKAHLVARLASRAGEARFRVRVHAFDTAPKVVLDERHGAGAWHEHRVSLADHAGRLVRLELEVDGDGTWGAPRIALEETAPRKRPDRIYDNAIIFVVDALRSDRLAVNGDTRVRTPTITKAWRERGVTFPNNQGGSPSSPPSHATIQTGMMTHTHGVLADKDQIRPGTPMISSVLGEVGVATGYFGNNPFGMARLEKAGKWGVFRQPSREGLGYDCTALVPLMVEFAREQHAAGKRFFMSALPYEPHTPYRYHAGISDRFYDGPWDEPVGKKVRGGLLEDLSAGRVKLSKREWQQLFALYDGEVEYMDRCFATLLEGLEDIGVADDTVIVLTSDHGEGMFEHKRMGHAFGHYRELADVPFVLFASGLFAGGQRLDTVTNHIDIVPTILDLMGVDRPRAVQGQSVVPLALRGGPWTPRITALEYGRSYALRSQRWKYIVGYYGAEQLYDLESDPKEQRDLVGENAFALRYMRSVAGFYLPHREGWHADWGDFNNHAPAFVDATSSP